MDRYRSGVENQIYNPDDKLLYWPDYGASEVEEEENKISLISRHLYKNMETIQEYCMLVKLKLFGLNNDFHFPKYSARKLFQDCEKRSHLLVRMYQLGFLTYDSQTGHMIENPKDNLYHTRYYGFGYIGGLIKIKVLKNILNRKLLPKNIALQIESEIFCFNNSFIRCRNESNKRISFLKEILIKFGYKDYENEGMYFWFNVLGSNNKKETNFFENIFMKSEKFYGVNLEFNTFNPEVFKNIKKKLSLYSIYFNRSWR